MNAELKPVAEPPGAPSGVNGSFSGDRPRDASAAAIVPARMPQLQLRAIYLATAALIVSGTVWLLLHFFGRVDGRFGPAPNPYEHPLLAVHGAAAMVFLIVLGSLLPVHIARGWQQRRNLASGLSMLTVTLMLIASGYGLYYFGGDRLRRLLSAGHWIIGLTLAAWLTWHIVAGRRSRRR